MRKRILTILLIGMLVFIWGNSLLSREVSGAISDSLMDVLNRCSARLGLADDTFTYMYDQDGDGVKEPTSHIVRKIAHVTEFLVFAALLFLRLESRGLRRGLTAYLCGTAVGGIDELLQLFANRGSLFSDVLYDSAGAAAGVLLTAAAVALIRKKNQTRKTA
ncbi:MAG: VanZ family protein [Oscillospiraceae bacterium]|nr:VanZ family protein [Oscillospiraceae bacterium]